MAAHILKLGNLDLSAYLRVAEEDGLDPLDTATFLEPQFSDSTLAEGAPLVAISQGNREMAFPLFLNSGTMDALADLMQSVKWEIDNTRPLRIEWRDQGASASTFYDVTFARLEPRYNYRRAGNAGKKWMGGVLHVYAAPPYGHTGTTRIVATGASATAAAGLRIPIPSAIEGDQDALTDIFIRHTTAKDRDGDALAVSMLPNASWSPVVGASSFSNPVFGSPSSAFIGPVAAASIVAGASGAPGGVAYSFRFSNFFYTVNALAPYFYKATADNLFSIGLAGSVYYGNVRVLAAVRAPLWHGVNLGLFDSNGNQIDTYRTATGWRGYSIVDLGRLSIPTINGGATTTFSIGMDSGNFIENLLGQPPLLDGGAFTGLGGGDPWSCQIAEVYVLPEDSTQFFNDNHRDPVAAINFSGAGVQGTVSAPIGDAYGNPVTATNGFVQQANGYNGYFVSTLNSNFYPGGLRFGNDYYSNLVTESFLDTTAADNTYTTPTVTAIHSVGKSAGLNGVYVGMGRTASAGFLSISGPLLVASAGFPVLGAAANGRRLILRTKFQGGFVSGALEHYTLNSTYGLGTYGVIATISASSASFQARGQLSVNQFTYANQGIPLYGFRAHAEPSYASVPSGQFEISSVDRIANYVNQNGTYMRPMRNQRGPFQALPAPSPAAVFVLQQGHDQPAENMGVAIGVRERFTFWR